MRRSRQMRRLRKRQRRFEERSLASLPRANSDVRCLAGGLAGSRPAPTSGPRAPPRQATAPPSQAVWPLEDGWRGIGGTHVLGRALPTRGQSLRVYERPTISPSSSMSIRSAAGCEPRPGIVRMSPQIG